MSNMKNSSPGYSKYDAGSEHIREIAPASAFSFACHAGVPCFNACCRDLNQFLTPYDILRLKHHFGMSAVDFLARYTKTHIGPRTGLPVVSLAPLDRFERKCPFITPEGCAVYDNRPSSCRIYPLIRTSGGMDAEGRREVRYFLLREAHCRGGEESRPVTAAEWVVGQGLAPYNEMNDLTGDVIRAKNRYNPEPLTAAAQRIFYTLCYDLDGLRAGVFSPGLDFLNRLAGETADDVELLRKSLTVLMTDFFDGNRCEVGGANRKGEVHDD